MAHMGGFSEDALKLFQEAASEQGFDFSENEVYDFTRCVRKDGSAYGTGGTCRKGSQQDKDPVANLRKEVRAGQAARGEADRQKNISDAKARVKEIQDEIKNRGPHTKEEKAELAQQLKVAQNNLKRFETGKTMTREEFQAGLKKMK